VTIATSTSPACCSSRSASPIRKGSSGLAWAQLHDGVELRSAEVDRIETGRDRVCLSGGEELAYDVLVIATGATLLPEETEGLTGPG
jgi:NADH dehydrogenase FAD-containing subunit